MRKFLVWAASGVLVAATLTATPANATPEVPQTRASKNALSVLKSLKTGATNGGYSRSKFKHWTTKNGCDTRARVLKRDSKKRTTKSGRCTIRTGKWTSVYDGRIITQASKIDIDHMVPLAEAWRSGAKRWNSATRTAFANDTGYKFSLRAVSASSNRSKSDRDPASWLPRKAFQCTYAKQWVAVKYRWKLTVDNRERKALQRVIGSCKSKTISLPKRASIKTGSSSSSSPKPSRPSNVYYKNCTAAHNAGVTPIYKGEPGYGRHLDRDGDGIACE